jgi:uncharacterized membrane protein YgcG
VPAGDAFSQRQQEDVVRAIRLADAQASLPVSVYVGTLDAPDGATRAAAQRLHAALGADAEQTVLVAVDPGLRRVEIVTGSGLAHRLDDRSCALAAISMTSTFQAGDLAGGIVAGINTLAEHTRKLRALET